MNSGSRLDFICCSIPSLGLCVDQGIFHHPLAAPPISLVPSLSLSPSPSPSLPLSMPSHLTNSLGRDILGMLVQHLFLGIARQRTLGIVAALLGALGWAAAGLHVVCCLTGLVVGLARGLGGLAAGVWGGHVGWLVGWLDGWLVGWMVGLGGRLFDVDGTL